MRWFNRDFLDVCVIVVVTPFSWPFIQPMESRGRNSQILQCGGDDGRVLGSQALPVAFSNLGDLFDHLGEIVGEKGSNAGRSLGHHIGTQGPVRSCIGPLDVRCRQRLNESRKLRSSCRDIFDAGEITEGISNQLREGVRCSHIIFSPLNK